jgi:hypothetical protein
VQLLGDETAGLAPAAEGFVGGDEMKRLWWRWK